MSQYLGPKRSDLIDAPLLSRFFSTLDSLVNRKVKVYVLGGTALTLVGLRKEGSRDIDISCDDDFNAISESVNKVMASFRAARIFIPITQSGKEVRNYYFPKDAIVQIFGTDLTENKRLPEDFHKFAHRLKTIEWVMPEGGVVKSMSCDDLFNHISIYTLGFADIFCSKIFGLRERDRNDLVFMIEHRGLYFRWHKKFILKRFQEFWKANRNTSEDIKKGAIRTYNWFQEKYPNHLLTLKLK